MVTNKKRLEECTVLEFKVDTVRLISENKGKEDEQLLAIMRINVQDLPGNIWMETNLRERNFKTQVAQKIKKSLIESPNDNFHLLNRGILISAHYVEVIEKESEKYVRIYLLHKGLHGSVDGGHTLEIIKKYKHQIINKKRVTIEVMTGVEDYFEELADARNTYVKVEDKSKLELEKKFDFIKKAIAHKRYAKDIAYKDNEEGSIDVRDIVAILSMFNISRYPNKQGEQNYPTAAYSRKAMCINWYREDYEKGSNNPYKKMTGLITDILELLDRVQADLPNFYSTSVANGKGQYGRIKGVTPGKGGRKFKRLFADEVAYTEYSTPNGFIYPIVGAFRYLIEEVNGVYRWKADPFEIWKKIGPYLTLILIDAHRGVGNNPNSTGKFISLWGHLYDKVKIAYLDSQE
ncbi:AIPR family protein [Priestia aryabhattai]|uniref:AIPR family protein n=1 Tax=Priestia aryabhattai TaxID=412384 RepID=UPI002E1B2464|nr:AIPR family protein [Priestia aryabhattai]